jgi:galactokinase
MTALKDIQKTMGDSRFGEWIARLYGEDRATMKAQRERYERLARLYAQEYPKANEIRIFSAPGRTEIAGNHTDHQHGRVLCASVDMDIIAMATPNEDRVIRLRSEGYPSADHIDLTNLSPVESERFHSASLIRGIASEFLRRGYHVRGFDAFTTSRVPKGSGLSSSAAFEILICIILNGLFNDDKLAPLEMAVISQAAENHFFGKPCGLMDQCGCSAGGVMSLDFKDPSSPVLVTLETDFESYGYSIVITNTGGSHADLNDDYASIPMDMKGIAAFFGKTHLRDVDEGEFLDAIPSIRQITGEKAILRAIHFFRDDAGVEKQAESLRAGDIERFLSFVNRSGISSWTCLQNIYSIRLPQEQPVALALALTEEFLNGKGAVRVHGGGFAGTIQAFVPNKRVLEYIARMEQVFGEGNSWKIRIRNKPAGEFK